MDCAVAEKMGIKEKRARRGWKFIEDGCGKQRRDRGKRGHDYICSDANSVIVSY